jgi:membrane-bound lytic murein transglycosylase D
MWQFMPGDDHAPPRSAWYDERFDPVAATHAYAKYMKYLYSQFGDWYLAMAAYDWGAGNVQKAVQRTGFADFWELYKRNNLPAETKNYVPIILAVTIMAKNPKQYGLDDLTPDPPLVEDTVQTNHSVGLALAADLVGATPQELAALNPALLRGATPPDETYNLHLPAGTKALFEKRIAGIPADKRHYWRYQTLADNETLEDVAKKYHVSLASLEEVNDLSSAADISDVDAVVVPVTPRSASLGASYYRVRRGDTLISIADRFNVSVEQLRAWNHLRGPYIRAGHRLRVAEPAHVERSRSSRRRSSHHTTRRSRTRHSASHKTRKGK